MAGIALQVVQGNTVRLDVAVTVDGGTAADLTGCTLWFTLKEKRSDTDANAVFQKKTGGGGIVVLDAAGGLARITLSPDDTAVLVPSKAYFFDVKLRTPTGDLYTPDGLFGTMRAQPWVTQATS